MEVGVDLHGLGEVERVRAAGFQAFDGVRAHSLPVWFVQGPFSVEVVVGEPNLVSYFVVGCRGSVGIGGVFLYDLGLCDTCLEFFQEGLVLMGDAMGTVLGHCGRAFTGAHRESGIEPRVDEQGGDVSCFPDLGIL